MIAEQRPIPHPSQKLFGAMRRYIIDVGISVLQVHVTSGFHKEFMYIA
jgi:hypothetical protein